MNELLRTLLFLPPQASTVAASIDLLHYFVILTTFAGAFGLGAVGLYFVVRYRRRSAVDEPPRDHAPATPLALEVAIIGGLFLLFFAWWAIGFRQYLRLRVAPDDSYDIYVTAKQWMWKFAYRDGHHSISRLYVPAGRPVRLIMTSRDVIHSFYVPDFRIKQDVLPGRYTTVWFNAKEPGRHDIYCAELCGVGHSTMRAEVIVLPPDELAAWLDRATRQPESPAPFYDEPEVSIDLGPSRVTTLARLGESIAGKEGCLRCHTLDGMPHIGPTFAGLYRSRIPLADGGEVIADESYLTESMVDPLAKIHQGFAPVMPSYFGRLRPGETAAIVELIRSLRDKPHASPTVLPPPAPPPNGTIEIKAK
jgi:cytochrome c oxidase subunit 2